MGCIFMDDHENIFQKLMSHLKNKKVILIIIIILAIIIFASFFPF